MSSSIIEQIENSTVFINGAPYEPSDDDEVKRMVSLLEIKQGEKAVDIGSGDGRVVIAMAEEGAVAYGFENDRYLVKESRRNIQRAKMSHSAFIKQTDFWDENYNLFDKIIVFQFGTVMKRLEKKLESELRDGTYVVSQFWKFPNWKYVKKISDVYLYIK
ncbi:MAG: methyltransferase domain-containing protein [Candidatus Roizmanbacteria bacterium]